MVKAENRVELVGQIMDCIEDFLMEKGIAFPETKQLMIDAGCSKEEANENNVVLYGENYDAIAEPITQVLIDWDILEKE